MIALAAPLVRLLPTRWRRAARRLRATLDPARRWDEATVTVQVTGHRPGAFVTCAVVNRQGALHRTARLTVHESGMVVAGPGWRIWRVKS